jgi:hypothetical protein
MENKIQIDFSDLKATIDSLVESCEKKEKTFKEELREIFPKLEDKVINRLVERFDNMEDLCRADYNILQMSLMGCAINKTDHIYNKLKKKRKELYIDLEDIENSLKYEYYDMAYNMSPCKINEKILGEFVSIIKSVNQEKAVNIFHEVLTNLLSDTVTRVQEFGEDAD